MMARVLFLLAVILLASLVFIFPAPAPAMAGLVLSRDMPVLSPSRLVVEDVPSPVLSPMVLLDYGEERSASIIAGSAGSGAPRAARVVNDVTDSVISQAQCRRSALAFRCHAWDNELRALSRREDILVSMNPGSEHYEKLLHEVSSTQEEMAASGVGEACALAKNQGRLPEELWRELLQAAHQGSESALEVLYYFPPLDRENPLHDLEGWRALDQAMPGLIEQALLRGQPSAPGMSYQYHGYRVNHPQHQLNIVEHVVAAHLLMEFGPSPNHENYGEFMRAVSAGQAAFLMSSLYPEQQRAVHRRLILLRPAFEERLMEEPVDSWMTSSDVYEELNKTAWHCP
jgi:hypothetical protein